jgi:hypothetical protein
MPGNKESAMTTILARFGIERVKRYRALDRYAVVLTDGRLGKGYCVRDAWFDAQRPDAYNVRAA